MKKILRKKIMLLIYELELLNIDGVDTEKVLKEAFEMLQTLVDEETFAAVEDMWRHRASAADKDSLTIGLMQFDRDARFLLMERKYL